MDPLSPDPVHGPSVPTAHRWENLSALLVLLLAGWFYLWTATSAGSPLTTVLQKDDLYNRLADGFLAGQLSFVERPSPALTALADPWDPAQNGPIAHFHDASYYGGRYYLYFGPVPALMLLAPWKAITGTYLGENVAAVLFAFGGVGAALALVIVLRRRHFPGLPGWITGVLMISVAFGNFVAPMLRRPVAYELAIAAGFAFTLAAQLCIAFYLQPVNCVRRRRWLVVASLSCGLAVGSRPDTIFGALILAVPFLQGPRAWRSFGAIEKRALVGDVLAAAIPFGIALLALLAYNEARFGRWTEFGTSYMLAGMHPVNEVFSGFRFLWANLWFYLGAPAQFEVFFPFFQVIHLPWFHLPAGYIGEEDMYGIIPNMPLFWFLVAVPWAIRDPLVAKSSTLRQFSGVLAVLVALNALFLFRLSGASNRYLVDLLPSLIPLACIGIFWIEQSASGWRQVILRAAWVTAVIFTAAFNVLVSMGHNDLLHYYNPKTYRRLAHAFDHLSDWLGATRPNRVGPLLLTVRFPADQIGHLQPLVVTGSSFKADFIYVFYPDLQHIQFGFEHTSYGGALTKPPVPLNYGVSHKMLIAMGSLYPPVDSPFYDGVGRPEIQAEKRTLRIEIDGQEVLFGSYDFYDSSPGDVTLGKNPVSAAFGQRFTGQIVDASRVPSGKDLR